MVLQTEQPKRKSNICILADSGVGVIGMLLLSHENSISYPLGYWLPCPNVAHHNIRSVGWYAHPDGGGAGGGGGGAAHFRSSHGFNYALTAYPEIQLHSITMAGPNMTVSALAMARCPLAVGCRLLAVWPPGGTSSVMDIFWTMALVKIQSANCCASFAMPTTVVVDLDWALDPDLGDNQCDLARQLNSCQCAKEPNGTSSLCAPFFRQRPCRISFVPHKLPANEASFPAVANKLIVSFAGTQLFVGLSFLASFRWVCAIIHIIC